MLNKDVLDYAFEKWSLEEGEPLFEILYPLIEELRLIDRQSKPLEIYSGADDCTITYLTPRGWKISVFNDCGGWDYIDDAIDPKGNSIAKKLGVDYLGPFTDFYQPTDDELKTIWTWRDW